MNKDNNVIDETRDRAKRLYQFVRELILLRQVSPRTLRSFEQTLVLDDLPIPPLCLFAKRRDLDESDDDAWLEVRCPKLEQYPIPPQVLAEWVDPLQLSDASLEAPSLISLTSDSLEDEEEEESGSADPEPPFFRNDPPEEITAIWTSYLEQEWTPWAVKMRPLYRAQKLYEDIFRMYQRQEQLAETYEIVLAVGLLSWRQSESIEIQRHLVAVAVNVELDPRKQVLTVRAPATAPRITLEDDFLDPGLRPANDVRLSIQAMLAEMDNNVWDDDHLETAVLTYCNALSANSTYSPETAVPGISEKPVVSLSPCLILRRRGSDGLIGLVDAIISSIDRGDPIPESVAQQVSISDELIDSVVDRIGHLADDEIYFPLPANKEQCKIIQHLKRASGIVVEGPPGTGKSQTIANLVCHLLACGNRVLVTSHTARALQVLRDKVPEEIKPLCVQALANDAKGMQALEYSVKGITDRHLGWDLDRSTSRVDELETQLHRAREQLSLAIRDQTAIREAEVFVHDKIAGMYSGTLASIARTLKLEEPLLGLIPDQIHNETAPPCSQEEFRSVLGFVQSNERQSTFTGAAEPVSPESLPGVEWFKDVSDQLKVLEERLLQLPCDDDHKAIQSRLSKAPPDQLSTIENELTQIAARLDTLRRQRTESWISQAIEEILTERDRPWASRLADCKTKLGLLKAIGPQALEARVAGSEGQDADALRHDIRTLSDYLQQKKSGRINFRLILPSPVKQALLRLEVIRINGTPCSEKAALAFLDKWAQAVILLSSLDKAWAFQSAPNESLRRRIDRYEDLCEPLDELLQILDSTRTLVTKLRSACADAGPSWHDVASVSKYVQSFERLRACRALDTKRNDWKDICELIEVELHKLPGDISAQLKASASDRDVDAYRAALDSITKIHDAWNTTKSLTQKKVHLEKIVPILISEIEQDSQNTKWQDLANRWEPAWSWRKARTWLTAMVSPEAGQVAARRVNSAQQDIARILASLSAQRAWAWCFSRLKETQRQALHAWSNAVKLIGKGTGKYANQHRRAAREHLGECQPAIPAWIMPLYRVAESIRPGDGTFDVAIIDEASQSGPEALVLLFLAKQIIVVGDDKQISPETFTNLEAVNRLRRDLISDIPANNALTPQNSFFDIAKIRYPTRIRLVEHFRSMPEIIAFSNDLCYKSEPLLPLRQFGAGRLEPVVNAVHVPTGFTKGKTQKVNPPEAHAIAEKVAEIIADPRYAGKSIGVISLLGSKQARLIESELMNLIDKRHFHERSIVCGEAYAFQGDERDIMLLSLVSAASADSRIGVLGKASDERRFNVAMSRARDQIWLFHSATLNDLNPNDLRSKLLKFCLGVGSRPSSIADLDVLTLARLARESNRQLERPPLPFDSWFELDVALRISAQGYNVVPQYDVSGYYIDLAVVGHRAKLGVECDGDHWHGPDRWELDAARQRDLERCGWPFFRIRESAFYIDPVGSLEPLWEELRRHQIFPHGHIHRQPTEVTEVVATAEVDEEIDESNSLKENMTEQDVHELELKLPQDASLPPFQEWQPRTIPNPRLESKEAVITALCSIIEIEGPTTWRRVFDRYRIGLGLGRLKGPTRESLEAIAKVGVRSGRIIEFNEAEGNDWYDRVIRTPSIPTIRIRQRGNRSLTDIPISEIAALIREKSLVDADEEWSARKVLEIYGLRRLTHATRAHLAAAQKLAVASPPVAEIQAES